MATVTTKTWTGEAALLQTAIFGGSTAVIAADQKYDYTANVKLETNGEFGSVVSVSYKGNNVTDDLIVDVFASQDGTTANFDTEPFIHKIFKNNGTIRRQTFVIAGLSNYRIGLKSSGTDTTFEYEVIHDRWTITNT